MSNNLYRYDFNETAPIEDIEAAILLALWASEALHGEAQVRLDASYHFDVEQHCCILDANTAVGRDFNRLFISFVQRELGATGFRVSHLTQQTPECVA